MSVFKKKIVTETIRGIKLAFTAISQREFIKAQAGFKFYGKLTKEESLNEELLLKANDEVVEWIYSKVQAEDCSDKIALEDLYELTASEIAQILKTIVQAEMREVVK